MYDCNQAFMSFGIDLMNWYMMVDPFWFAGFEDPFSIIFLAT